jgi:hypothetical protein
VGVICIHCHALWLKEFPRSVFSYSGQNFQGIYPQIPGGVLGQLDCVYSDKGAHVSPWTNARLMPPTTNILEFEEKNLLYMLAALHSFHFFWKSDK